MASIRSLLLLGCIFTLVTQAPMASFFGPFLGKMFNIILIYGPLYKITGSFGINIFRLCYMKIDMSVAHRVNWMAIAVLILTVSISINTTMFLAWPFYPSQNGDFGQR